jgi:hypothetical protein
LCASSTNIDTNRLLSIRRGDDTQNETKERTTGDIAAVHSTRKCNNNTERRINTNTRRVKLFNRNVRMFDDVDRRASARCERARVHIASYRIADETEQRTAGRGGHRRCSPSINDSTSSVAVGEQHSHSEETHC